MVSAPLVDGQDLDGFPGAPFTDAQAKVAGESVRRDARWHIAPSVAETVVVESSGGPFLFLPTLHLASVAAVRNVTSPERPVVVDGWSSAATARFRAGALYRSTGWPVGFFEVDITHGYDQCPDDLLPVIAGRAQSARVNQSSGSVSLGSLRIGNDGPAASGVLDAGVAAYRIPTPA